MKNKHETQSFLKLASQKESLNRALRVAVLVGIILNLINNPSLFQLKTEGINIYRVLLTFLVPFCVSLYSSVLAHRKKCPETVAIKTD
ncbi:MAG: nitrate/nitrite transporter NrtS [Prolixibacteraceae bacterium]|nr:nitrate/nitrite transporter NrtS [Prolixibacteraceae bacterium]